MRTYDITVRTRPNGRFNTHWHEVASYVCESSLNIRAVLILVYQRHFGKTPGFHWAASGSLCQGQAWNAKRCTRATCEIEIFQHNRMSDAYHAAREVIWNASQPRLTERRAA